MSGRAGRREYWLVGGPLNAILGIELLVLYNVGVSDAAPSAAVGAMVLTLLPLALYLNVALGARRLHDRSRSAFWLLGFFGAPAAAAVLLSTLDQSYATGAVVSALLLCIFGPVGWGLIELGLLESAPRPNRYGPDPRGRVALEVFD